MEKTGLGEKAQGQVTRCIKPCQEAMSSSQLSAIYEDFTVGFENAPLKTVRQNTNPSANVPNSHLNFEISEVGA